MHKSNFFLILCLSLLLVFFYGCNEVTEEGGETQANVHISEQGEKGEHAGEREGEHAEEGEHKGEAGEHAEEGEGEEAGPRTGLDGTYDEVQKESRLILTFIKESSAFEGTVENVSEKALTKVRIEVHLSNGTELGPTEPVNLEPGEKKKVTISAEGQIFQWWKAHVEVGESEHRE